MFPSLRRIEFFDERATDSGKCLILLCSFITFITFIGFYETILEERAKMMVGQLFCLLSAHIILMMSLFFGILHGELELRHKKRAVILLAICLLVGYFDLENYEGMQQFFVKIFFLSLGFTVRFLILHQLFKLQYSNPFITCAITFVSGLLFFLLSFRTEPVASNQMSLLFTFIITIFVTLGTYYQHETIKEYATENISLNIGTLALILKIYAAGFKGTPISVNLVISLILIFFSLIYSFSILLH